MSGTTSGTLEFITPTFWGDLDRFRLQRQSIARCGITIPQTAIVEHEDLPRFAEFRGEPNLTLLSTADVLPASLERRRRASRFKRRDPRRWQAVRPVQGWFTQQLCKVSAAARCRAAGVICLDSDIVFVRRVEHRDFFAPDGTLHLHETAADDMDAEMAQWLAHSMRVLGVSPRGKPLARYVHALAPIHAQVARDLQQYVARRAGRHWAEAMAALNLHAYPTYGVFARHINHLDRLTPVRPQLCVCYWWRSQFDSIQHDFLRRVQAPGCKAVLINSNGGLPVASYRRLVEQSWDLTLTTGSHARRPALVQGMAS